MFEPQVKKKEWDALRPSARQGWIQFKDVLKYVPLRSLSVCLRWQRRWCRPALCPTAGGEGGERSAQEKS